MERATHIIDQFIWGRKVAESGIGPQPILRVRLMPIRMVGALRQIGIKMNVSQLPITRNLNLAYALSLAIILLMAGLSMGGLLYQSGLYPTSEMRQSFVANDVVNLFIGLPILVGSIWLTRRGDLVGLLFWPGALLYVLYNYIAYVFGIPLSLISWLYLALVGLSAYTIYELLKSVDEHFVQQRLSGVVPVRISGWVLVIFGVAFFFRAIGMIAQAGLDGTRLPVSEIGVLIADLVLSMLMILGGAWLLRRMPLGYVSGLGLLFAASMLFIGLIVFLLLQPLLTAAPFSLVDVIVVFMMGLICFIPFVLFLRGVVSKGKAGSYKNLAERSNFD
jgi:hypothetical protein